MNEALKKELERYYLSDAYDHLADNMKVQEGHSVYYKYLEPLRQDIKMFADLESAITESEVGHELQGFLRGYEYCLTMLGLNKENALSQQDA